MVDDFEVSVLNRAAPEVAEGLGLRVSSMSRGVLEGESAGEDGHDTVEIGPRFVGQVAMASADQLVVIGHVADHTLQVWAGTHAQLTRVTELAAPVPAGGLVSLARLGAEWHLFARSEHGRSSHLVSTDLCHWTHMTQLVSSFPAFAVSGVAVRGNELLLAGRVFVDNTAFGWGLLRSDGRNFEARPVPLPLATQLGVVGPTVNRDGDAVLLLDSGHNRTVATSSGAGWTLSLLGPAVQPTVAFADGADLWLAGADGETGAPCVAKLRGDQVIALPDSELGRVRSAIVHDGRLVLAREC